jgi:hypothetical protein
VEYDKTIHTLSNAMNKIILFHIRVYNESILTVGKDKLRGSCSEEKHSLKDRIWIKKFKFLHESEQLVK